MRTPACQPFDSPNARTISGRNHPPRLRLLVCATGLGILTAVSAFPQSARNQPVFEVASVKASPVRDLPGSMNGGPLPAGPFNMDNHDPSHIAWTNMRLIRVLMMAYDLPADRISGPGWLHSETYDIQAPVPPGITIADFKLMVRNLLAERFRLSSHREMKEVSGYALEIAPGGLRIKHSTGSLPPADAPPGAPHGPAGLMMVDANGYPAPRPGNPTFLPGSGFSATIKVDDLYRATVLNQPMASIAAFLGTAAGMPVEDHTGLTGIWDFHLEYKPSLAAANAGGLPEISAPAPDLFEAVQKQLGLKLTRRKVAQETLVVDHAEKVPTEN
jgi:uncharacterized protein (TIGR03435 family)